MPEPTRRIGSSPDLVGQVAGRRVAESKRPFDAEGRDAVLGVGHVPRHSKPTERVDMSALHERARGDGEAPAAHVRHQKVFVGLLWEVAVPHRTHAAPSRHRTASR